MPPIWTTPRNWPAGELITSAIANSAWRDEFMYLKDSPTFDGNVSVTGTLGVTGATSLSALGVSGLATLGGAVNVTGLVNALSDITAPRFVSSGGFNIFSNSPSLGINPGYMELVNTGGSTHVGMSGDAGQPWAVPPYAAALYTTNASGIALKAAAGTGAIYFYTGGATERMRIFASGGVNIGGIVDPGFTNLRVTGTLTVSTSGGNVSWGTYSPGISGLSPILSVVTPGVFSYSRVGNTVTVAGTVAIQGSGTGAAFFNLTLPIPSNFTTTSDAGGAIAGPGGGANTEAGSVYADVAGDNVLIRWTLPTTALLDRAVHFTYRIN